MGRQERVMPRRLVRRHIRLLHLQSHPVRVLPYELWSVNAIKLTCFVSRYHSHIRRRDAASLTTLRLARDCLKVREFTRLPSYRMMC